MSSPMNQFDRRRLLVITGAAGSGSRLKQWNWDGNTNLQWQLVDLGGGWYRIVNRTNGMVADSWGNSANGATPGSGTAMWAPNSSPNNHWTIASV